MATIDNAVIRARQLVGLVGRNTGRAVSISKLKMQVVQQNSLIQSTYERMGTLVYEQKKVGSDNSDTISACMSEIDAILAKISNINTKIMQLREGIICSVCSTTNIADTVYCQNCGHKLVIMSEPMS